MHDISITFSNYHITSNREQLHFYLKTITQINNFARILFESIYHDFKVQQAHSLSIEIESINQVSLILKNLLTIIKYSQQETKNLIEHNSELTDFERWLISSPCCRKFSKINPQDQITLIESSQNFQKLTKEIAEKEEKNLTELEKIILNNILNNRLIKTYITLTNIELQKPKIDPKQDPMNYLTELDAHRKELRNKPTMQETRSKHIMKELKDKETDAEIEVEVLEKKEVKKTKPEKSPKENALETIDKLQKIKKSKNAIDNLSSLKRWVSGEQGTVQTTNGIGAEIKHFFRNNIKKLGLSEDRENAISTFLDTEYRTDNLEAISVEDSVKLAESIKEKSKQKEKFKEICVGDGGTTDAVLFEYQDSQYKDVLSPQSHFYKLHGMKTNNEIIISFLTECENRSTKVNSSTHIQLLIDIFKIILKRQNDTIDFATKKIEADAAAA